uniref:Uncharacterized protein n=1 Tax=Cacopsylla melanoneura TaxID=428564 RepID=A0A8D8XDV2_9HEMI
MEGTKKQISVVVNNTIRDCDPFNNTHNIYIGLSFGHTRVVRFSQSKQMETNCHIVTIYRVHVILDCDVASSPYSLGTYYLCGILTSRIFRWCKTGNILLYTQEKENILFLLNVHLLIFIF